MPASILQGGTAQQKLRKMREIQDWGKSLDPPHHEPTSTAPDYCLGASKFLVAKLVGLVPAERHLNDFLKSFEAGQLSSGSSGAAKAWGDSIQKYGENFNQKALPAAIKWGGTGANPKGVSIVYEKTPTKADDLLGKQVPLVVGVSMKGTGYRDHWVAVVMDKADQVWAVDPWADSEFGDVVKMANWTSFLYPVRAAINARPLTAVIPCTPPIFGYYARNGEPMVRTVDL